MSPILLQCPFRGPTSCFLAQIKGLLTIQLVEDLQSRLAFNILDFSLPNTGHLVGFVCWGTCMQATDGDSLWTRWALATLPARKTYGK